MDTKKSETGIKAIEIDTKVETLKDINIPKQSTLVMKYCSIPQEVWAFKVEIEHCREEKEIPFKNIKAKKGYAYLLINDNYPIHFCKAEAGSYIIKTDKDEYYVVNSKYFHQHFKPVFNLKGV